VIIVDDGSDDNGPKIVETYLGEHKNIQLLQTQHIGLSAARNLGLKAAYSTFVALLDCDDYWGPRKLENQLRYLQGHPECNLVFSNCYINNEISGTIYDAVSNEDTEFTYENVFLQKYRVIGSASSVCLRVENLKETGMFSETLTYGEDYDLWVRMALTTQFHEVKERDVFITVRSNSMQTKKQRGIASFRNSIMYFEVWTANRIDFLPHLNDFKKLIWPDFSRAMFRHPLDALKFLREIRTLYPKAYNLLFSTNRLRLMFCLYNVSQAVSARIKRLTKTNHPKY
jgi:glycosyltransferase involved in cell wall biosynthesis